MYTFQVEDYHTYHVGNKGILVHNAGDGYGGATNSASDFEKKISKMSPSERVAAIKEKAL